MHTDKTRNYTQLTSFNLYLKRETAQAYHHAKEFPTTALLMIYLHITAIEILVANNFDDLIIP